MRNHQRFFLLFLTTFVLSVTRANQQCSLPDGQKITSGTTTTPATPHSTSKLCSVPGERYIFDLSRDGMDIGCLSLPLCPRNKTVSLLCGCDEEEGDLDFFKGHVWVVHMCTAGQFCLPDHDSCLPSLPGDVRSTTRSGKNITIEIDKNVDLLLEDQPSDSSDDLADPDTTDVTLYAAGVPGQKQTIRFQNCLPYDLSSSNAASNVGARCGAAELSFDGDHSTVSIAKLELEIDQQDAQVIVRGEITATFNLPNDAPATTDPQSRHHVKLVSLVCALGGEQTCVSNSQPPMEFVEIHRAAYSPREVDVSLIGGSRPFIFVHNLGVDFACAQSTYVVTCAATLHYSRRGTIHLGPNGCPLRDGTERLVRYSQSESSFSCSKNSFFLGNSFFFPVDPLHIFQYKKLSMGIKGYTDTPLILTNSTQLLDRIAKLAQASGSAAVQSGLPDISIIGNVTELMKMDPIFVDIGKFNFFFLFFNMLFFNVLFFFSSSHSSVFHLAYSNILFPSHFISYFF